MIPIFILFFLFIALLSVLSTIPLSIVALVVCAVTFRKSWVFFAGFFLGLFLDLTLIRPLGYTGLVFTVFIFIICLYERKFEAQTLTFIFISTFLGSLFYLWFFEYQMVFLQALISVAIAVLLFKFLWLKLGPRSETI